MEHTTLRSLIREQPPNEAGANTNIRAAYDPFVPAHQDGDQNLMKLLASLHNVLDHIESTLDNSHADDAMAALALDPAFFIEPLSSHEVDVLACGLITHQFERDFNYNDILTITDHFRGRPMNTTMVYKTIGSLIERGLVEEKSCKIDARTERISRTFSVLECGRTAFRLAVANAGHLNRCKDKAA